MIHSSYFRPKAYPFGSGDPVEIDRLQSLSGTLTLNREKIKEIGRDGIVDWRKMIPTLRLSLGQHEYGSLEFFKALANKGTATDTLTLADFKSSMVDICGYKTSDTGTFLGTVWYPKLRLASFGISIGDPQAYVERTFELVGEDEKLLQEGNKYLIMREFTADGGSNEDFIVSDGGTTYPDPIGDPDNSGYYILKVVRVRAGTATELIYTTDYTYTTGSLTLTVVTTTSGDKIRIYWSAASYITGATPFTVNDTDDSHTPASSCSIYLEAANYLYKLQSVSVDVALDRSDYYEIGDDEVIQRGVRDKTCTITLGRILHDYTIEEVARGVAGLDYGIINPRKFADNLSLIIKVYSDDAKGTFRMKYLFNDVSPSGLETGVPIEDYVTKGASLEGASCVISTQE